MNKLTTAYHVNALTTTRPTITIKNQPGVDAVTAVAKTLANRTMALGQGNRVKILVTCR